MYEEHCCRGEEEVASKLSCCQRVLSIPTSAKRKDLYLKSQVTGEEFVPSGIRQQDSGT